MTASASPSEPSSVQRASVTSWRWVTVAYALLVVVCATLLAWAARQAVAPLVPPGSFSNPEGFLAYHTDGVGDHLSQGARQRELFLNVRRQPDGQYVTFSGRLESAPFRAVGYLAVPLVGPVSSKPPAFSGQVDPAAASVHLLCTDNGHRLELLAGVNLEFHEHVRHIPADWCAGPARLVAEVRDPEVQVGVGTPVAVSVLRYAAQQPLGYAWAAVVMSGLVTLMVAPFLLLGGRPMLMRIGYAVAYLGAVGFVQYLVAYAGAGKAGLSVMALGAICAPMVCLWWFLRRGATLDPQGLRAWALGMAGCVCLFILLSAILPLNGGAWFPNSAFYPVAWSTDNHLPTYMAKYAQAHGSGKPPGLGPWSITDRGFLPAGLVLVGLPVMELLGIRGEGGTDYLVLHALQFCVLASVVPLALQWAALDAPQGRLRPSQEALLLVFLLTMPFMVFNLFYVWPKLFSAVCALLMVVALHEGAQHQDPRIGGAGALMLAGALGGWAVVSHAATVFALPVLMFALLWVWGAQAKSTEAGGVSAGPLYRLIAAGWRAVRMQPLAWLGALALMLTIVAVHDGLARKTSYGATFALTGQGVFGLDAAAILEAVRHHYTALTAAQWIQQKWEGLKILVYAFEPLNYYNAACRTHGQLACMRAAQFSSVVPALGTTVVALLAATLVRFDVLRADDPATVPESSAKALTLPLTIAGVAGVLLVVLTFQNMPIVHHMPYALLMAFVLAATRALVRMRLGVAMALVGLQALLFVAVWVVGSLQSWRELGVG